MILLLIILFLGVPFLLVNWNDIQPMISSLTKGKIESVQKDAVSQTDQKVAEKTVDQDADKKAAIEKSEKTEVASKPVFQGVEIKTGENGKVLGIAPKGWTVNLKSGDKIIGSAVASDQNGQWIILLDKKDIPAGEHKFVLEALSADKKNSLMSVQTLGVTVFEGPASIAQVVLQEEGKKDVVMQKGVEKKKVTPAAANVASSVSDKKAEEKQAAVKETKAKAKEETLKVDSLDYKSSGEGNIGLVAKGDGTPGETVQFFVNNKSIGTLKVDKSGKWMFRKTVALEGGNHQFKVTQGAEILMRTLTYRPVVETSSIAKVSEEVEKSRKAVRAAALAKEKEAKEEEQKKKAAEEKASADKVEVAEKKDTPAAPKLEASKTVVSEASDTEASDKKEEKTIKVKTLPVSYIVIHGDSLWGISDRHYGNGMQYWKIYKKNRRKIRTPDLIYPGQKFIIP